MKNLKISRLRILIREIKHFFRLKGYLLCIKDISVIKWHINSIIQQNTSHARIAQLKILVLLHNVVSYILVVWENKLKYVYQKLEEVTYVTFGAVENS